MNLTFFDSNIFMGRSSHGTYCPAVSGNELIEVMDNSGIEKALVWHIAQEEYSPVEGNRLLSSLIQNEERLFGCWTVLPPQTDEMDLGVNFFRKMKEEKIVALRIFPEQGNNLQHRFLLNRVVFGDFMDEITRRKIPLFLSIIGGNNWQYIYSFLSEFPHITCILCNTGNWGSDRYFRPLLENYNNVYLESSFLSIGDGVIEGIVKKYGSKRIVFGSNFPIYYPESTMLQLIHADITDDQKRDIACGNLERLIGEVIL